MITIEDVVGLEYQKEIFYENVTIPIKEKELYDKLVLQPDKVEVQKNFLFYGPSGTGKTFFAKAIANTLHIPYEKHSGTEYILGLVGEGAKELRKLYQENTKKIIFIDEIDSIGMSRSLRQSNNTNDVLIELLNQLDGINPKYNIITIAATNVPEVLDPALMSRFNYQLEFQELTYKQREQLIEKNLSYFNNKITNIADIITQTENLSPRQIKQYFNKVKNKALKNNRSFLINEDFNDRYYANTQRSR